MLVSLDRTEEYKQRMEDFAELMQRLLEIQGGGRPRNPKPVAEDQRVTDRLEKRILLGKPPQAVNLSQESV
jgi:hypothetical protein